MRGALRHRAILLVMGLLAAFGCERRPLLDPSFTAELQVVIDDEGMHNVTCDIYNPKIQPQQTDPEMLRVLFYEPGKDRIAGESYISNVSTDSEGRHVVSGRVGILPGDYEMVIYNFDTPSTYIRNDYSHPTIEAYTQSVSEVLASRFNTRADEPVDIRHQPNLLWVATDAKRSIPWHDDLYTIKTTATPITETFYLQVKVEGLEWVSSAQAILTGMAGSNMLGSRQRVDIPETAIYFSLQKSDDKGAAVLCSVFNSFGHIDHSNNELWVSFNINTVDGRVENRDFNISALFDSPECRDHNWLLLEEVITIDKPSTPPTAGGGFKPEMEDWKEEHFDLEL